MTNAEIIARLAMALGIMVGLVAVTVGLSFLAVIITEKIEEKKQKNKNKK